MPLPGLAPQNIRLPGLPEAAIPTPEVVVATGDIDTPEMNDKKPLRLRRARV